MRFRIITIVLVGMTVFAFPAAGQDKEDGDNKNLAAASLLRSATELIYCSEPAAGRAARLMALGYLADRFNENDPRTHQLLAGIYENQGDDASAVKSLRVWLAEHPGDYTATLRWLSAELAVRQTAQARIAFLQSIVSDKNRSIALRAESSARHGQILLGQGLPDQARLAFLRTISLDSHHRLALDGWIAIQKNLAPADRADVLLRILSGEPSAVDVSWELAALLDRLGLYDHAVEFFSHTWRIAMRKQARQALPALAIQYFNAMLNAGKYEKAITTFEKTLDPSTDLQMLLIEAYRKTDKHAQADKLVETLRLRYEKAINDTPSPGLSATVAWFYLVTLPKPEALAYANTAYQADPQNITTSRILAAAELESDSARLRRIGKHRLMKLVKKDIYAAALAAKYYLAESDPAKAKRAILAGLALSRSGPAARKLLALARKCNMKIKPAPGSEKLARIVDASPREYLQMIRAAQKYLKVTLQPEQTVLRPGQVALITATLTNISRVDLPLGQSGLLSPVMGLRVEVTPAGSKATTQPWKVFKKLPLAIWPTDKILPAGKSFSCQVRIDLGPLGDLLRTRPFEKFSLKVSGILDPIIQGDRMLSASPQVVVKPVVITRMSLLAGKAGAVRRMMSALTDEVNSKSPAGRMRAAGTLALLMAKRENTAGSVNQSPAEKLFLSGVSKQDLLTLLGKLLADNNYVVRAEVLAALVRVKYDVGLDSNVLAIVKPLSADKAELVRFRLIELLGKSDPELAKRMSRDASQAVGMMARAFETRN